MNNIEQPELHYSTFQVDLNSFLSNFPEREEHLNNYYKWDIMSDREFDNTMKRMIPWYLKRNERIETIKRLKL